MAPSSLESRVSKVKSRKREDGMVRAAAPPNRHGFSAPSTNKRKSRKPTGSQRAASPPLPPSTSQVHSFRAASQPADSCSASLRSPQTHLIAAARGARFSSSFFFVLSSGGGGQLSSRCRRPLDGCPPPRGMDATGPELQNNSLTRPFLYQPAIPMLKEGGSQNKSPPPGGGVLARRVRSAFSTVPREEIDRGKQGKHECLAYIHAA